MKKTTALRRLETRLAALTSWLLVFSIAGAISVPRTFAAEGDAPPVVNPNDPSDQPNAGDLPSVGGETIPVETGKPVSKTQKAREPYRKSRLTKDISEAKADRRRVLLSTGEDKVVDLDFDVDNSPAAIQVGNTQVTAVTTVRIGDQRRQLIFKPLKGGETTVTVRDGEGTIKIIFDVVVTQTNLLRRAGEIRELLRDVEGIDVKVVGANIVIDGEVFTSDDYARLRAVTNQKGYTESVLLLAKLAPLALTMLAKKIQEDVSAFAPNVKTRIVNGLLFLEGTVDQLDQARRAEQVARLYFPDVRPGNQLAVNDPTATSIARRDYVYNFIVVNPQPPKKNEKLVKLLVHVVELAKDYSRNFGFTWSPGFTADPSISYGQQANGATGAQATSFSATLSSLIPKLKSAQDAGFARVLKQGTIITKSGVQGTFTESTSIYLSQLASGSGTSATAAPPAQVQFISKLTPTVLGSGEEVQVEADLTNMNLVGFNGSNPIIGSKSMHTVLYIKSGESAAIGGFESTTVNTAFNKDKFGDGSFQSDTGTTTEPLFNLKRTKNFAKQKGQFVVFVTPQIIDDASQGSEDLKRNFRIKVK
ncbi:MAG: BON domain-containing protein [Bdellovibrionales bacterium]|nr:BON domain-containing protein [Bdellovibrionales bacterium]